MSSESSRPSPRVSVITPTRNRPRALRQAVRSVLDQTMSDLEHIVINDGEGDLDEILGDVRDPRLIRLVNEGVHGPSGPRNFGLRAARGHYIAYLDDDDIFYPQHLAVLTSFLDQSDRRAAYTDAVQATVIPDPHEPEGFRVERSVVLSMDFNPLEILVRNITPNLCLMHERACLKASGLYDEKLSSHVDWDFYIRLAQRFPFAHIKEVTAEYVKHPPEQGSVSSRRKDMLRTLLIIYRKYERLAEPHREVLRARQQFIRMLEHEIWPPRDERLHEILEYYQEIGEEEQARVIAREQELA